MVKRVKKCSVCGTVEVIKKSYFAVKNGKFGKVLIYACRNPKCPEYGGEQKVFREIETREED